VDLVRPMSTKNAYPSLAGRHVFLSGGATGIGAAMVAAFAAQNAHVSFVDIDDEAARALAKTCNDMGGRVTGRICDVRDVTAYQSVLEDARREYGPIEVLVNNAASDDRHSIENVDAAYWDERLAVNLRHQFFAAQAVRDGMRELGRGVIINLGSTVWLFGAPHCIVYATAKAAVTGMTRSMARELGPEGIRVNCIVPGWVMTERQRRLYMNPASEEQIDSRQCLRTRIEPDDIAAMALFLASDDARSCTGQNFIVDAGWT
jgi:NAD(P)-dependent dehydrogenase (short-subunit alcohol dehydrogenase family)